MVLSEQPPFISNKCRNSQPGIECIKNKKDKKINFLNDTVHKILLVSVYYFFTGLYYIALSVNFLQLLYQSGSWDKEKGYI